MTFLVERLAELRKHLAHLRELRPRVASAADLGADLSLHNDVLFSLLMVSQLVIDIAGELGARRGLRFENYTEAIRNLEHFEDFDPHLVRELARLPGFRNILIHEYAALDLDRAVDALDRLDSIDRFIKVVARFLDRLDTEGEP